MPHAKRHAVQVMIAAGRSTKTKSKLDYFTTDSRAHLKQTPSCSVRNHHWNGEPMDLSFPDRSTGESSSAKLRQLSDEVSRIATTLAKLAIGPGAEGSKRSDAPANNRPASSVSVETVRQVIQARRIRAQYFGEALFADPAWDMLLDLFHSELAQLRVSVSSLCIAAAVPATTALRWINTMKDAGLLERRPDRHDGRRVFIELSPTASEAMRRYFGELENPKSI